MPKHENGSGNMSVISGIVKSLLATVVVAIIGELYNDANTKKHNSQIRDEIDKNDAKINNLRGEPLGNIRHKTEINNLNNKNNNLRNQIKK